MDPFTLAVIGLGIGGAIFGGVTGGAAARKQNQAIAEAASANIANLDKNIEQSRLGYLDVSQAASRQAQSQLGTARNAIGFDSGNSITQYIAAAVADDYASQFIRKTNE